MWNASFQVTLSVKYFKDLSPCTIEVKNLTFDLLFVVVKLVVGLVVEVVVEVVIKD